MNNQSIQDFDVIILGAGINGAGLYKDLCINGLKCLIVDKADFGSGTSAAPSRLIHGGIKYLETAEFRLVAQSTLERNLLLKNAPHFVKPLPTFIPVFSWFKGSFAALRTMMGSTTAPRSRGAALIKIGMSIYDFYGSRQRVMPKHKFLSRAAALKSMPQITPRITAGGIYYDAKITHPERLVYELIQDGLNTNQNNAAYNYMTLEKTSKGCLHFKSDHGRFLTARAPLIINAAGPWIDHVNQKLGVETKMIGGTKGSHILIDHPDLIKSLDGKMIYFEADDGRICLVYEYHGLALIGSTDIKANNPDEVVCLDDEIEYFLNSMQSLLPGFKFARGQIVYSYSGIRPLPASNVEQAGLISRDHSAPIIEKNDQQPFAIISLIGGKWTTFRGFAEEVANLIFERLKKPRSQSTQNLAIGGGKNYPKTDTDIQFWIEQQMERSHFSRERIKNLLNRYGMTAEAIISHIIATPHDRPIEGLPQMSTAEIDWIARHENIVHLGDIVMRRTTLAVEGKVSKAILQDIAVILANVLGWDQTRQNNEVSTLMHSLEKFHHTHFKAK